MKWMTYFTFFIMLIESLTLNNLFIYYYFVVFKPNICLSFSSAMHSENKNSKNIQKHN